MEKRNAVPKADVAGCVSADSIPLSGSDAGTDHAGGADDGWFHVRHISRRVASMCNAGVRKSKTLGVSVRRVCGRDVRFSDGSF